MGKEIEQDEVPSLRLQFARQEFSESFSRGALLIRILDNLPDSWRKRQKERDSFTLRFPCETKFSRGNSKRSQVQAYSYSQYIVQYIRPKRNVKPVSGVQIAFGLPSFFATRRMHWRRKSFIANTLSHRDRQHSFITKPRKNRNRSISIKM